MLDITKSRIIDYDQGRKNVIVYQDHDEANLWYIVPEPILALGDGGIPKFSLVRYETQEGITGVCTFIAELNVTPEAKAAVLEQIPQAQFGQLIWQESSAYFKYLLTGEEALVTVTPSSYGNNQAAFVIELPNKEAVDTFVDGFGPTGVGQSPFTLFYDVTTLTQLRAVEVGVEYNANMARQYEKQVDIDRNVWGNEKSRKTTIKEALQSSDAGDVYTKWGIENPSAELQQRVADWAWTTLEGLVDQAVTQALNTFGPGNADNFSMSYTGSFKRTYKEDSVIDWLIDPVTTLPRFDEATWAKVYVQSDQRRLSTSFTVRQLGSPDNTIQVESVTVQTRYPAGTSQYTGQFTFEAKTASTWLWEAPGQLDDNRRFVPFYEYQYTVRFKDSNDDYTSEWIKTDETDVQFTPGKLAFLTVQFTATIVDFIFITPTDTPPIQQQITLKSNATQSVASALRLPSANKYTYSLTYVMKDGNTYKVAPITTNQQSVSIQTPFTTKTVSAWLITPDDVKQASVNARYDDNRNNIHQSHRFQLTSEEDYQAWAVNVVDNPNGFVMDYSGVIILADGRQRRISNVKLVGDALCSVSTTQDWFTVTIDPQLIKWTNGDQKLITLVDANFYLLIPDSKDPLKQIKVEQFTATFSPDSHDLSYWSFLRDVGAAATYYYEAQYHHSDGVTGHVDQTGGDFTKVTLPPDAQSEQPRTIAVSIPADYVQAVGE
jgi:hypothetical protein